MSTSTHAHTWNPAADFPPHMQLGCSLGPGLTYPCYLRHLIPMESIGLAPSLHSCTRRGMFILVRLPAMFQRVLPVTINKGLFGIEGPAVGTSRQKLATGPVLSTLDGYFHLCSYNHVMAGWWDEAEFILGIITSKGKLKKGKKERKRVYLVTITEFPTSLQSAWHFRDVPATCRAANNGSLNPCYSLASADRSSVFPLLFEAHDIKQIAAGEYTL